MGSGVYLILATKAPASVWKVKRSANGVITNIEKSVGGSLTSVAVNALAAAAGETRDRGDFTSPAPSPPRPAWFA